MGSVDELTVTKYSEAAAQTPEAKAILNKSLDDNEGLGDVSDEEPYFTFQYRGKQKSQIAGKFAKTPTIRPVEQLNVDEAKADKANEDKANTDKANEDKANEDKANEDKANTDKAKADIKKE